MAATKVNANWTAVQHDTNAITRVTSVEFDRGGQLQGFSADGDRFRTLIVNLMNEPSASVTTADVGTAFDATKFAPGTGSAGGKTLTATLKDTLGASGGDVVFAMANSVIENVRGNGSHASFASATITFKAFSSDGTTNPLSITRS